MHVALLQDCSDEPGDGECFHVLSLLSPKQLGAFVGLLWQIKKDMLHTCLKRWRRRHKKWRIHDLINEHQRKRRLESGNRPKVCLVILLVYGNS